MVISSPYPDVSVPEQSLTGFVLAGAWERGDKPALVDGLTGRTLSYRELAEQVRRVGHGLRRRGVCQGNVLAICLRNIVQRYQRKASSVGCTAPRRKDQPIQRTAYGAKRTRIFRRQAVR